MGEGTVSLQVVTGNGYETEQVGEKLARTLSEPVCVCLYGDLGAGKTTFIRGLARGLQIEETEVRSPTYVFTHAYDLMHPSGAQKLWHMDLYRLSDEIPFDLLEPLERGGDFFAIEWPEKIADYLPEERLEVYFDVTGENERTIRIQKNR